MTVRTIAQIKQQLENEILKKEDMELLRSDKRKGVQKLLAQYEKRKAQQQEYKDQFERMKSFEYSCKKEGRRIIAGIDEAGRGPLAGPVVAAAVILPDDYYLEGLYDSKKIPLAKREEFFQCLKAEADFGVGIVSNDEIDQHNIYQATKLAMKRAVMDLKQTPEHLLIDAMYLEELEVPQTYLVKGDQRSVSIAAASIIAKVTRDRIMSEWHANYPMYQFQSNQGYGTKEHLEALKIHGVSPLHRKSFAPVRECSRI
ncbi:ribonuclease HII [Halobacillus sp. K22]|uniref:ribonuclease HII n=1 Tax=Halobacillus sp. K22 TaxID=3457431 RepID=UPI003FCE52D9